METVSTKYLNLKYRFSAADDDDVKKLAAKYKKFYRHNMIYEAAVGAFASIGRAFTSQELGLVSGEKPYYTAGNMEMLQKIIRPANPLNTYLDVQDKLVETRMESDTITMHLNFGNIEAVGKAEKVVKQYFPDYETPRNFKAATVEEKFTLGTYQVGDRLERLLSVEEISRIVPGFTAPGNIKNNSEAFRFKLPKGYKEANFSKIAYVRLVLRLDKVKISTESDIRVQSGSAEGSLITARYRVAIPLETQLVFKWPKDFARYVTCAESDDKFVPFLFYQYVNWHRIAYAGKRTRGGGLAIQPPARINHLENISDMIATEIRSGRQVKPRINDDNFAIMGTGEPSMMGNVVWIEKGANKVPEYMAQIRSAYNISEKRMDLSKLSIKGTSLFADFYNEKLVYIREAGSDKSSSDISGMQTLDLIGSVALDDITIAKELNRRIDEEKNVFKDFMSIIYKFIGGVYPIKATEIYVLPRILEKYGFDKLDATKGRDIISQVENDIVQSPDMDITWATLGGRKITMRNTGGEDTVEGSDTANRLIRFKRVRAFCNIIKPMCQDLLNNFDQLEVAYSAKVQHWRFIFTLITKYANSDADYQAKLAAAVEKNTAKNFTKEQVLNLEGLNFANLPGIKQVMPHQSETFRDLSEDPKIAFIELTTGGGKTPTGLVNALDLLQKNKIKRPLVGLPGHLVKNWASEIRKFSQGEVNVFIITIQTIRRLMQVYRGETNPAAKPNYSFLKKIIEACPPNTIFLTNFRFFSIDREEIVYGNTIISRFYSAEFLRELGFDYVTIDESQGVKALGSNQTKGASVVASVALYKRLMSGTIINNTLLDLVGQSAVVQPSALGNTSTFISNYGASYSGDDDDQVAGEWRPDAASLIIKDMRPFVKRIIHKRQRIAFMLPEAVEDFHPVEMTPTQQAFYDAMLSRKFEELREKNPKLFAKMLDGNEKDDASLTMGLATHFQAVEAFLNAPDSVPEFMALDGLEERDKISPKLPKIVELLDQHLQGTIDNTGDYDTKPDVFKVIIVGNRRVTSAHIYKHLPERYRKIAVHYTAENKQAYEVFEKNDRIRIMVADGTSITTGLNAQYSSRMIRVETVWAPGDLEQLFARIYRPAFNEKTGKREKVYLDWLMCENSLDVAKVGRIISKLVEKVKYDRQEDLSFVVRDFTPTPEFMNLKIGDQPMHLEIPGLKIKQPITKMLNTLPLIKMNSETLMELKSASQLSEYFATYALINDYEKQEFDEAKKNGLQQLIPIPDSTRTTIAGSRKLAYQPRVPGIDPSAFDPQNKFGYQPISIVDSQIELNALYEDDDVENYVEVNPVSGGELVDTEFGIGVVSAVLQNEVWVTIKGLGQVRVPKATAWLITNPVAQTSIKAALERGQIVRNPPGIKDTGVYDEPLNLDEPVVQTGKVKRLVKIEEPPVKKTLIKKDTETEKSVMDNKAIKTEPVQQPVKKYDVFDDIDEDEENAINIYGLIVDGQISLSANATDRDSDMLVQDYDFKSINRYFAIKVLNPKALNALLDALKSKFTVRQDIIDNFEPYSAMLKAGTLNSSDPTAFTQTMRFLNQNQVKFLKEGFARPFPLVMDGELFVTFDYEKTKSIRQITQTLRKAAIPGTKFMNITDDLHIKFYKNSTEALEDLNEISQNIEVSNMEDVVEFLKSIKKKRLQAPTITEQAVKKTPAAAPKVLVKKAPDKKPVLKTLVKKR